ncbi:MAG TPA: phage tail protein [Firmicutes bacterium]|nr:phage tail protein [Bacillota bacterium]
MAGRVRRFRDKYKFLVEIDGIVQTGFQKAGPLRGSVGVIEHEEGGALLPDKSPGKGRFEDITLEWGATESLEIYNWFAQVLNAAQGTGGADPDRYKRNMAIIEQDRAGREVGRWNIYGAWPREFEAGDWDNTSEEKLIRKVALVYDYFEPAF